MGTKKSMIHTLVSWLAGSLAKRLVLAVVGFCWHHFDCIWKGFAFAFFLAAISLTLRPWFLVMLGGMVLMCYVLKNQKVNTWSVVSLPADASGYKSSGLVPTYRCCSDTRDVFDATCYFSRETASEYAFAINHCQQCGLFTPGAWVRGADEDLWQAIERIEPDEEPHSTSRVLATKTIGLATAESQIDILLSPGRRCIVFKEAEPPTQQATQKELKRQFNQFGRLLRTFKSDV